MTSCASLPPPSATQADRIPPVAPSKSTTTETPDGDEQDVAVAGDDTPTSAAEVAVIVTMTATRRRMNPVGMPQGVTSSAARTS
jgi:hypothetical protein